MYPLWVFTLKKTDNNKLFLATGTWFAPIYYQAKSFLEKNNSQNKVLLLFWLRYEKDVFYKEKLEKLKQKYKNFDYKIFLSREMQTWYEYWYISSYLSKDNIKDFDEFYICWWPQVVKPIVEDLKEKSKENIFFESY
jgi:NAD(P)H-flavin reductase